MSSILKTSLRCIIPLLLPFFYSTSLNAVPSAAEQVGLKIGNSLISVLGKRGCTEQVDVVVELSANLKTYNAFQATHREVKKDIDASKAKGDSLCDAKLAIGRKTTSFTKAVPHIPISELLTTSACQSDGISEGRVLCIYEDAGGNDQLIGYALYRIETAVTKIDSIVDRTAINGEVSFEVRLGGKQGGAIKIDTCYGKTADGDIDAKKDECPSNFTISSSSSVKVKISGLDPVEYAFKVRIDDPKDGAKGDWSASFKETPVPVAFPLDAYKGRGSELGCSQSKSGDTLIIFLPILFGLFFARARKGTTRIITHIMIFGLLSTVVVPEFAHADLGQVSLGILGSLYRPDLDNETLKTGEKIFPFYKCFFRKKKTDQNGPINPLMGGEVDMHLWDGIGSLQLGFGFGYTFVNGHALKIDSNGNYDCDNPITTAKTTLHMYQIRPQLTYVFDYFAKTVPLVPYIRGALISHGYVFRSGNSAAKGVNVDGVLIKPNGFRFGYQGAIGLMLMLDFLEPGNLKSAHSYLEHVFIKAELSASKIDSFGRAGFRFTPQDVMGTSWPLMWTFALVFELPSD